MISRVDPIRDRRACARSAAGRPPGPWTGTARSAGAVVTVEDHQIIGGLGGAIAECLAANHPVPIEYVGVKDRFGVSGEPDELFKYFGLTADDIVKAAKEVISRKR